MADELAVNALAARLHQVCRFPDHKGPQVYWDCFVLAREALTALRSAGFLIVHPMQRGPEDPTFVMPDITAVHHTKET